MNAVISNIAKKLLRRNFEELSPHEQHIIKKIADGTHISRNTNKEFESQLTFGQRLADKVAQFGGSWFFIILFMMILVSWIVLNTVILKQSKEAFDPYPYILLNLFLSMIASIQAPIIMMSQNRHADKDRLDASHDYEVNLKAELEILQLHQKFDSFRDQQLKELIELQKHQIEMLGQIIHNNAKPVSSDGELTDSGK
jgi:uncharacterized membrane protein